MYFLDDRDESWKVLVWVFINWQSNSLYSSSFNKNNTFIDPLLKSWHLIVNLQTHYQQRRGYKCLWYQ